MTLNISYTITNDVITNTNTRQITISITTTGSDVLDDFLSIEPGEPLIQTFTIPVGASTAAVVALCRIFIRTTLQGVVAELNAKKSVGIIDQVIL